MQWLYGFHKFIILVSPTAIKLGAKAFTTSDYARHDIFTGHTKRIAAGNPYARLNDPRATTTGLVPLLGGLARTGLIVATPTGWRRTRPELRDLAAARLCVAGRLDAREGRYKAERDLWEWWQVGLEWLTTPGRHKRRHQPTGQIAFTFGRPWDIYPLPAPTRWPRRSSSGPRAHARRHHPHRVLRATGDSARSRPRASLTWSPASSDSTPAPTASATSPDGSRETPTSSDRAPAVYWPPRTGSPKLSSRTPLISSNSANRANSMKGTNRMNSENKPGRRPTSRRPGLSRPRCSRGLTDDGFYPADWWIFLSLSGWSRLTVVVLRAIYWHWVVPGECAFREVDHDILLSYLPGTMERVPMGLRVVRRRDAFAATVAHSAGASGSVPSWRVIRTVVASSSTMARTP